MPGSDKKIKHSISIKKTTNKAEKNLKRERENLEKKSNKGVSTNPKRGRATNPGRKEISNFKTVTDTFPPPEKNQMQPRRKEKM